MQHNNYYDDERPLGEDNFSRGNAEYGDWSSQQWQQYIRIPPPPSAWTQNNTPTKVKLPPFLTKDTRSWFTLAESTFNHSGIADPRLASTWSSLRFRRRSFTAPWHPAHRR